MPLWFVIADVLLWFVLFVLHAVRFEEMGLSRFELKRRMRAGDAEALRLDERERLLPRVQTLLRGVIAILLVLAAAVSIMAFGWLLGTLLAAFLSLLVGTAGRIPVFVTLARKLYQPNEGAILDKVEDWDWLDWFRGVMVPSAETILTSKDELLHVVERSVGVLTRDELLRFQASMSLDNHTVADVMTPVSVIETADVRESLGPLVLDGLHKTGHSRFPVIDGDIHHIVGILYLHDIINLRSAKATVREAMDPRVHYIHQDQTLEHALHGFLRTHRHLFIVVNEYRETVGVLTLEDVLETLLGKKIVDEFDQFEDLRAVAESNPKKNNLPKGKTDI